MRVASDSLTNAIDAVNVDKQKTQSAETQLRSDESQAEADVQRLADARQAAEAALTQDDAVARRRPRATCRLSLVAGVRRTQAAEQAEEKPWRRGRGPAKAAPAAQAQTPTPVSVAFHPSPGPRRPSARINALTPERTDQGVDYSGYGPIYAIGDGVVLSTVNAGWPGGTFIAYRLSDGPASGLAVYAAEDIDPLVTVGQSVTAGTVLGTMYEGPEGIETGWADPSGDGNSMANDAGPVLRCRLDRLRCQLLAAAGDLRAAPPGVPQNDPPIGTLPAGWPAW